MVRKASVFFYLQANFSVYNLLSVMICVWKGSCCKEGEFYCRNHAKRNQVFSFQYVLFFTAVGSETGQNVEQRKKHFQFPFICSTLPSLCQHWNNGYVGY